MHHLHQALLSLIPRPPQETLNLIKTNLLKELWRSRGEDIMRRQFEGARVTHTNETSRDSHQPVRHLAEPVGLIETEVIIFILSPNKQTWLLSYRGRLERNTLERPERQADR